MGFLKREYPLPSVRNQAHKVLLKKNDPDIPSVAVVIKSWEVSPGNIFLGIILKKRSDTFVFVLNQ